MNPDIDYHNDLPPVSGISDFIHLALNRLQVPSLKSDHPIQQSQWVAPDFPAMQLWLSFTFPLVIMMHFLHFKLLLFKYLYSSFFMWGCLYRRVAKMHLKIVSERTVKTSSGVHSSLSGWMAWICYFLLKYIWSLFQRPTTLNTWVLIKAT